MSGVARISKVTVMSAGERQNRETILELVNSELYRQNQLWGTPRSQDQTPDRRLSILSEEVGEYARAILEHDPDGALGELVQIAAVAVANAERIIHHGPDYR